MCASAVYAATPLRALSFAFSPLLVFGLLYKVSGIPLLEKASDQKYGHLDSYKAYKKNVPELIPRFTSFKLKKE